MIHETNSFSQTFQLAGCTNDIMTSDHSPVFASFEVGVASQFVSKQGMIASYGSLQMTLCYPLQNTSCDVLHFSDLNSEPQGGIQIMNCVATLLTKSKTKFFIEYHSSCLESMFFACVIDRITLDSVLTWTTDIKTNISLNVYRSSQDFRGRERGARWVNKSSVWQHS